MTWPRAVLTVALPPLSVYIRQGLGRAFWLNALLTLLFYLPGVAHAFWVLRRSGSAAARPAAPPRQRRPTSRNT